MYIYQNVYKLMFHMTTPESVSIFLLSVLLIYTAIVFVYEKKNYLAKTYNTMLYYYAILNMEYCNIIWNATGYCGILYY